MTKKQALSASHRGDCLYVAKKLSCNISIQDQLKVIGPEKIREELRGYGAWEESELLDDGMNQVRIIWLAADNIRDELAEQDRRKEEMAEARFNDRE